MRCSAEHNETLWNEHRRSEYTPNERDEVYSE